MKPEQKETAVRKMPAMDKTGPHSTRYSRENISKYKKIIHGFSGDEVEKYYHDLKMDSHYLDIHEDIGDQKSEIFCLHSHTFYVMICCHSGDLQYFLNGKVYHLQKNDILLISPELRHGALFFNNDNEPYHRTVLWISPEFYHRWAEDFLASGAGAKELVEHPCHIIRPQGNLLAQIHQMLKLIILEKKQERPASELFCSGALTMLLCLLYRVRTGEETDHAEPEQQELLANILDYIDRHLPEKLSMKSVSTEFLISQSALGQLFKKHLGISFYKFIVEKRLNEAKLLIVRNTPLKEIPDLCGFSDYSAFYKAFTQKYGISPRTYKQSRLEVREMENAETY